MPLIDLIRLGDTGKEKLEVNGSEAKRPVALR